MGYANGGLPASVASRWREPIPLRECRPPGGTTEGSIVDAKTGANTKSAKFVVGDTGDRVPDLRRHDRPAVIDIGNLYAETGMFTYDPGFTSTGELRVEDHLHRRRRGRPALSRLSDRAARRATATSSRPAISCSTASCRPRRRRPTSTIASPRHTMVHEQMSRFFSGLPPRRASDGGDGGLRRRALGVLSRLDRHLRSDTSA